MSSTNIVHVIDDDPMICSAMQMLLETAGFDARTYVSAPAFLAKIEAIGGRCVVSDVQMPKMTGIELLERLKRLSCAPPVILMTGSGDVSQIQAMNAGAVALLQKPFDPDDLIASVRLAVAAR